MTEFEKVLQECLYDVEHGLANVEECLSRYPNHAQQLEPVLLTSVYLQRGRDARPSAAFKARVRTKLIQQMHAQPRRPARSGFLFMRFAPSLVALMIALFVTGTAYAQRALPGEAFYAWKLASEDAWRVISPDPVETDLAMAERRVEELIAVRGDPALSAQVLNTYLEVAERLKSEVNAQNEARIITVLDSQLKELNQSGILLPQLGPDPLLPIQAVEPTLIPSPSPTPTPLPIRATPQVDSTDLSAIVPTIQVPSEIVPTVQVPPEIIPTIQVPEIIPTVPEPLNILPTVEISSLIP
jgi:hypothetical protein